MTFYETFVARCQERGISPSAAATAAGISRTSVTRWKKGSQPSDVNIASIASALGLTVKQFWHDEAGGDFAVGRVSPTAKAELINSVTDMDEETASRLLAIAKAAGLL